jgi:hypothetical protein
MIEKYILPQQFIPDENFFTQPSECLVTQEMSRATDKTHRWKKCQGRYQAWRKPKE